MQKCKNIIINILNEKGLIYFDYFDNLNFYISDFTDYDSFKRKRS